MIKDAKWLADIRLNAGRADRLTAGQTRESYLADETLQLAMERAIQNCGEAAWKLSKANPPLATRLPRLGSLISLRHRLVHDYDTISHVVVWQYLVEEKLAADLRATADTLLREVDPDAPPE